MNNLITLGEIEQKTRAYADARDVLNTRVQTLQDEMEVVRRRKLAGIKAAVATCAQARDHLEAVIAEAPHLFEKPRTLVIAGIRIGYTKGAGKLVFEDADKVVALIHKHLPESADYLVRTKSEPVKKALAQLSVADLKRIGVTVEDTGDVIVIKPTDDAVDKLVSALLRDAENSEG